ncbi:MAG: hypothetical protein ABIR58_00575 [Gemmatimonadaceae bacterium]
MVDQRYVDLLERVNQQLDMAWTPYAVTFTILAIIVALLSIDGTIGSRRNMIVCAGG